MPTSTETNILYRIEHGDQTVEYTDWDVAHATLVKQLEAQFTAAKGTPATKTIANNRRSMIESAITDAQHGHHHGIGGVRLALSGVDTRSVPQERIDAAQAATDAAQAALNAPTAV